MKQIILGGRGVLLLTGFLCLGFASGCGKSFVTGVQVNTYTSNGDSYAGVAVDLALGSITLPTLNLPITDPFQTSATYGTVDIGPGPTSGSTALTINVDLTTVAKLPVTTATLPNGTALPVSGLTGIGTIELPVGNTSAKIYLAFGTGVALVGAAIPISQMDGLGGSIGASGLFIPFTITTGVTGTAGVFTGSQAGENGIGVFVNAGGLLPTITQGIVSNAVPKERSKLSFPNVKPDSEREGQIQNYLQDLDNNHTRCTLN